MTRPAPSHPAQQYNNRALVPDHPEHLAAWTAASRHAQAVLPCQLDIPYATALAGEAPNARTLDVYPADTAVAGSGGAPVLVFVHGGYWRSLDKADHGFVAPFYTERGACVVVPNYPLCPQATVPGITLAMVQALVWVYRHIGACGGDRDRITVVGHSAGGQLAAQLMTCLWPQLAADLPQGLVRNALSLSGLHDLQPLRGVPFLQTDLKLDAATVQRCSPARLPAPSHGPTYAVVGGAESEAFLWQNTLLRQAWGAQAVPVCEAMPGLNHFTVASALAEPGHRLSRLVLDLLGLTGSP